MIESKPLLDITSITKYLCDREMIRVSKVHDANDDPTQKHIMSYQQYIESMHIEELLELYKNEKNNEVLAKTNEARYCLDKFRFFNMPEASADVAHYLSKIKWTREEAVSLCFGKDPKVVNMSSLNAYVDDVENDPDAKYSAFIKGYFNIMDILLSDPLVKEKNSPAFYLKWFNKHRIYVCEELQEQAIQRGFAKASDYQWMEEELLRYLADDVDNLTETEISVSDISIEHRNKLISDTHQASMSDVQDNIAHKKVMITGTYAKQNAEIDDMNISERSRNSYLRIIAALIEYIEGATIGEKCYPHFPSLNAFIGYIVEQYQFGNPGISESHLSHIIPVARRKLFKKKVPQLLT